MTHIAVFRIKWRGKKTYCFNRVIITTILLKQHKITASGASSQVQKTVLVCGQIEVQADLGNNLDKHFLFLSHHAKETNRNVRWNFEETQVHTQNSALQCTLGHFIREI